MERDTFLKLALPGYGPTVDTIRTKSINPLDWSRETQLGIAIQATVSTGGLLSACNVFCEPTVESITLVDGYPHLVEYYPEMRGSIVYGHGSFETTRTSVEWVNFSQSEIDVDALASVYIEYENYSKYQAEYTYTAAPGVYIPFVVDPRFAQDPVLFIVPSDAPRSSRAPLNNTFTSYYHYDRPVQVVEIPSGSDLRKATLHTSVAGIAQRSFRVEACQITMNVWADPKYGVLIQEIFCNSKGAADSASDVGIGERKYHRWARSTKLSCFEGDPGSPLYVFEDYGTKEKAPIILKK